MKAIIKNNRYVDDKYGLNLMCCLDRCDKTCGLIHECWLSPYTTVQLTLDF